MKKWLSGTVIHGDQTGRTIGFPTVNFDPNLADAITQEGVYAADVRIDDKEYTGVLYLGPRLSLGETNRVLEIHILDFDNMIYGKTVSFTFGQFIRPPQNFASLDETKQRLADDIAAVRRALV